MGRGRGFLRNRKFADSPLEEDGFEPSVPVGLSPSVSTRFCRQERWKKPVRKTLHLRGTEGSNPSSSSGESANHRFLSVGAQSAGNVPKRRRSGRLPSRLRDTRPNQARITAALSRRARSSGAPTMTQSGRLRTKFVGRVDNERWLRLPTGRTVAHCPLSK